MSVDNTISNGLTSSAEGSPARTSATPASAPELPAPVRDSGGRWCVAFAWYDRSSSSWRTWQLCLGGGWAEFSETWPRPVMTRTGIAFRPQRLERLICGEESGLWPTPVVADSKFAQRYKRGNPQLNLAVKLWPTPRAHEVGDYQYSKGDKTKPILTLTGAVKLWATPSMTDGRRGPDKKRSQRTGGGRDLVTDVGGQLNPMWVEWLMGYPAGWTVLRRSATPSSRNASKKS